MPRRKRYKLPASTKGGSSLLYWTLVLLLLAGFAWIWLRTSQTKPANRPPTAAPRKVAAVAPVQQTNPPAPAPVRQPVSSTPRSEPQPDQFPRPARTTFEAQLALSRRVISAGSIDGVSGLQTRAALIAFQRSAGLPPTGTLDPETRARLMLDESPTTSYAISPTDLTQIQPVAATWLGKSQQTALNYETVLELVAERFHAHPAYIRTLNPGVNWTNPIPAGTELRVPNIAYSEPEEKAAVIRISLSAKTLQAFGYRSNLLAHFPCSIAQRVEKRPVGELHVVAIAPNPNYTFNPEVFPESAEAQAIGHKLILPPGPNNPVGVAWISLDLPGYGLHGTPNPEQVGRTESHGCFRLANWNAEYLIKLVSVGTPVLVEP